MKRLIIILIAVALGAMAIGFVLNLVDSDDDDGKVAEVEGIVEEPAPISFFDLLSVAAPVIRNEKSGAISTWSRATNSKARAPWKMPANSRHACATLLFAA